MGKFKASSRFKGIYTEKNMQRYSRLLYRTTRPMMMTTTHNCRPMMQTQMRSFARQGYLEDTEALMPMIAPFDDVAFSKKMVGVGVFLLPMFLTPFGCLLAYMFRS